MKKFTLKILASYVGLYAIINAGWGVSVFYLIPFSLSSQRWLLATEGFLVWFLTLLFALSILSYKVRIIQRTLTAVDKGRDLSDRDILDTLKKSSDLPLFGMFLYSVMTVITVIVTFVIWKMTGIGTISAAAIFVALLPGGVTCASMQFAAFTLLTIKGNDRLTLIAVQKKLQPETTTIGIRSKAYLSVGLLGVGVALWMFGFAYYSVVNKVVDETKVTSLAFHTVLAETFSASEHDGDLLNQLENRIIHAPFGNSGFMFLADRQGKFLAIPEQKTLFVEHWPEINQQIRQDFKSLTANSIYDNVDEKIITYTPVGDAYMLGTVEYLIGKLPTTRIWIWGGIYGLPAFLVTIILGWSLSSTILHSIHAVSSSIRALSQGKLFIRHGTSNFDETGILVLTINRFSEELSGTIEHIITIANDVSASSGHVRDIAEQVAQRSTQQAASAEEVSASMEEMSSSIRMNSDNSQHAKQEAKQVSERIAHVKTAVVDTKLAMQNIVKKISVINEFSRKTNLLSLNAAVEAARAGDAGKGFAVLASEIRALAEQSLRAVQTIEEVSQTSLTQAEYSEKLLEESLPSILSTTDLVQEIAAASMEQSSGTILINQSVQDLASVTQQNSASAETMASNSDVLTQHASTLLETISLFKTSEDDLQRMSETELKRKLEILTSQLHTVQSARQNREETPLETAQRPRRGNTSF